jgi:transglutaminase-like putative cysteine protease
MKPIVCGVIAASALFAAWSAIAGEVAPIIVKKEYDEAVIGADRHVTRTLHLELQATNDSAAAQIGEQAVPYNETMQTLEILDAYTLKANGERIQVTPDAIHTQQRRESPRQSLYDDLRQKVVIFPNVAGGDSIVLTARWRQNQHYIPGQVFVSQLYDRGPVMEDARETIVAPKDFPLYIESHDLNVETVERDDTIVRTWRYASAVGAAHTDEPALIDPDDHGPRLYASSLRTYEELGRTYAELVLPKLAVTPAIETLANDMTKGIVDRREQAQRIYNWVSRNIRYVALEFGQSSIVPHDAGSIADRGYGDCKDHAVLLMALLKAKGIESEIVLIDAGSTYTLSAVPRISQFNHAIVYLPEFDLYVDATAGVAPFGVLPFGEYGKPVVHAVRSGVVVRKTPVMPPTTLTLTSNSRFETDGRIIEDSTVEVDGAFSIAFRNSAQAIQIQGTSRYIAGRIANSDATGALEFEDPLELSARYALKAHVEFEAPMDWLSGQTRFGMRRSVIPTPFPGDFLMGPLSQRGLSGGEPTACYSGGVVEELSFAPPPGRRFAALPEDIRVATANLEFTSRWSSDGDRFIQHREFRSRIDQPLCTGNVRKETHNALIQIGEYYRRATLWLEPEQTNQDSPKN